MFEWYLPWARLDWVLRAQALIWLAVVVCSYWIAWRVVIRKRPWLRRRSNDKK